MQLDQAQQATLSGAHELGVAIRQKRLAAGLTLALAAPMCGVSVKFLQALETGKPTVQFNKALAVAAMFGVRLVLEH
jgi:HTH-type transcriptional regulator / antitoxin HipB